MEVERDVRNMDGGGEGCEECMEVERDVRNMDGGGDGCEGWMKGGEAC